MSWTNAAEGALLDLFFLNTDWANVGDAAGLQNSAAAGSFYVSLHDTHPGEAGSQTTGETTYGGYARQAVARSAAGWARSGSTTDNVAAITFPACTSGGPNTVFYVGLGSDLSGAGNLFQWGILGTNKGAFVGLTTDTIYNPNHGLSVDDRVAFFAIPGGSLPTGITEGTVYWVKTAPDTDTITISATQGGATLDITADGNGVMAKMIGLTVTASPSITPKFNIGDLDFTMD